MKTTSSRWGWLSLSLGILALILTWSLKAYALLCWAWVICSLSVAWIAFSKLRFGPAQCLLLGASFMNATAGVANGLVMTANGMRMPVERIEDWAAAPAFLDSPSGQRTFICRLFTKADGALTPRADNVVHFDVPRPWLFDGTSGPPAKPPHFAFLDDRHGIRVCGQRTVFSKGDLVGFFGTVFLGIPGIILLILGFLRRKIRRKPRAPAER